MAPVTTGRIPAGSSRPGAARWPLAKGGQDLVAISQDGRRFFQSGISIRRVISGGHGHQPSEAARLGCFVYFDYNFTKFAFWREPQSCPSQRKTFKPNLLKIDQNRFNTLVSFTPELLPLDGQILVDIAQELDAKAQVKGPPCGSVAAHLGHVACDSESRDAMLVQPLLKAGLRKAVRPPLVDEVARPFRPRCPPVAAVHPCGCKTR